jgi:hypothetical protein
MPEKLIHGQSSVGDDPPERSLSDLPMVGYDHTDEWVAATKDHLAAGLTAELEPGTFQSQANLASRQIGATGRIELSSAPAGGSSGRLISTMSTVSGASMMSGS